jgi:hypothetical protein
MAAKPKACNPSEGDRPDLRDRCTAEQNDECRDGGNGCAFPVRTERPRHAPKGLADDRDGDKFQAMQQSRSGRATEGTRPISEQHEHDGRGQGKADPRSERAAIAGAHQPNGKSDLAAGRAGQELTQPEEIGIDMFIDPFAPHDEFLPEYPICAIGPPKLPMPSLKKTRRTSSAEPSCVTLVGEVSVVVMVISPVSSRSFSALSLIMHWNSAMNPKSMRIW